MTDRLRTGEQLLALMTLLRSRRHVGVTLDEMAAAFEVSRKTAGRMRDAVARLEPALGSWVDDEGRKRWYLPQGPIFDVPTSATELADLETAARHCEEVGFPQIAASLRALSEKLKAALDRRQLFKVDPDLELLGESFGIAHRPGPRPRIDPDVVKTLRDAILSGRCVRFAYRPVRGSVESLREVAPYGFLIGRRHYLVGRDTDRNALRHFALGGISVPSILSKTFERPAEFNMQEHAARSFGVFHDGQPIDVELVFSAEAAKEAEDYRFHPKQTMARSPEGELIIRFTAESFLEIAQECVLWRGKLISAHPPALLDWLPGEDDPR